MSGAVISSNTSLKVSSAVSASVAFSPSISQTVYTCAANSYAMLNVSVSGNPTSTYTISVGNRIVYSGISGSTPSLTIYVGPSQALSISTASGTCSCNASGVELINSP